ncbi:MAG: heme exporter protein CcmD [Methylococcaceae bacterium]|nr:heme exporter protein CcmD [Methylococcaceae bacterium]
MNLAEFFAMGGYAFYVWTSYGIALVVVAFNIIQPLIQQKRALRAIRRRRQRHRPQATTE